MRFVSIDHNSLSLSNNKRNVAYVSQLNRDTNLSIINPNIVKIGYQVKDAITRKSVMGSVELARQSRRWDYDPD